jgi:CxxC motif-containing protein (DUF1111 family)
MSARTLRLLIAFGLVFLVFVYLFSVQVKQTLPVKSPEEGLMGGPLPGLTLWQLSKFEEGRTLFQRTFGLAEGLGPLYNGASCAECHGGARTPGGTGAENPESSITRFARRKKDAAAGPGGTGAPNPEIAFKDLDLMIDYGGPILLRKSITDLSGTKLSPECKLQPLKTIPPAAEFHGKRSAVQLYGLGLVNVIPDAVFQCEAERQRRTQKEVHGKATRTPALFSGWNSTGRFGVKAQEATLIGMIAQELAGELGITNQLSRHTCMPGGRGRLPDCLKSACPVDPNDDGRILARINFFLTVLAPPPRATITPAAAEGAPIFAQLGCSVCHLPQLKTPRKVFVMNPDEPYLQTEELPAALKGAPAQLRLAVEPTAIEVHALENKSVDAYSDFLVHDMGPALNDKLAQPGTTGGEWRTAPLWGLRYRKVYLHDGRASTLARAIELHAGEAKSSTAACGKLSPRDRERLFAFLNSL